jgi:hypothetical protein
MSQSTNALPRSRRVRRRRERPWCAAGSGVAGGGVAQRLLGHAALAQEVGDGPAGGEDGAAPWHHVACGTPVEARWWCRTCARVVDPDEASDLRWA